MQATHRMRDVCTVTSLLQDAPIRHNTVGKTKLPYIPIAIVTRHVRDHGASSWRVDRVEWTGERVLKDGRIGEPSLRHNEWWMNPLNPAPTNRCPFWLREFCSQWLDEFNADPNDSTQGEPSA